MRYAAACLVATCLVASATISACSPKGDAGDATDTAKSAASKAIGAVTAPPKPKVGLWESKMVMTAPQPMTVTNQMCLDEAMLADDAWMKGGDKASTNCTQNQVAAAGGYAFESKCVMGGTTITSKGAATGDFNKSYRVDLTSKMDPVPQGAPAETQTTIVATYLGPCPAGQAGGVVAGSLKMTPGAG